MKRGSWRAGKGLLVFTVWLGFSAAAAAQSPQSCGQDPMALPAWLGIVPDPGSNAGGTLGEEYARDVLGRLQSPEHVTQLEAEKARLAREVFGDALRATRRAERPSAATSSSLLSTERIYFFISESIPLETLRNYARDIAEIADPRIVMVLRGFVGGMRQVLPTRRFVLKVLRKDLGCDPDSRSDCELYAANVIIDPLLFRRYGIKAVPSVVYTYGAFRDRNGRPGSDDPDVGSYVSISGDAEFGYLLESIGKHTGGRILDDRRNRGGRF